MRIFLLSDTHSHLDEDILEHVDWADEVWHAGDVGSVMVLEELRKRKPLRVVFGNIDGREVRIESAEDLVFECEGMKVWMTHIGGYPPKYNRRTLSMIKSISPQLFICGHSHITKVQYDPDRRILHFNPGAAGTHGYHKIRTALRFVLKDAKITEVEVIEFTDRRQRNLLKID